MPLSIVYLDDELDLLIMFTELFSSSDFVIKTFQKPEEAIHEINVKPPDLVIFDYRLPNTTGDKIALSINPDIPKVLISGDLSIEYKADYLKIFRKPYSDIEMREFLIQFKNSLEEKNKIKKAL